MISAHALRFAGKHLANVTGGNFRLLERLLTRVARAPALNRPETVMREVVQAACEVLAIGTA